MLLRYTLLSGKYTIKEMARDDDTGRIRTFQADSVIPNLNKETKLVPINTVVLAGQRVEDKDAISNSTGGKNQARQDAADPLMQLGGRLISSVNRVFSKGHRLYVCL